MHIFVLLQPIREELAVDQDGVLVVEVGFHLVSVLEGDGAAILLAYDGADDGLGLLAGDVAGDVVGDCEQDERVELHAEGGVGGFGGEEGVRHVCGRWWRE